MQSFSPRGHADASASPIDPCRPVEIDCRIEVQQLAAQQEAAKVGLTLVGASTRGHLHEDGIGHGQGAVGGDQRSHTTVDRAPGRTVELHPRGRVRQDHATLGPVSAGIRPMARTPRMAKASSRVIG